MEKPKKLRLNRRGFLKGAAAGAAALVTPVTGLNAQTQEAALPPQRGTAAPLTARAIAAETAPVSPDVEVMTEDNPGSDFMVDVIKALGFEYIAANPGSSFRCLHESIINYGKNSAPELLTCCHEESSIAIADGYFRVE